MPFGHQNYSFAADKIEKNFFKNVVCRKTRQELTVLDVLSLSETINSLFVIL